ncbi:hypothetical protein ACQEV9_00030 [Streptomyces chartreusis]|uniref:hypothetical protein n=1 Tax=Streptomyces chartreusis TaxID=1969 RepID=UPI003D8FED38
MQTRTVALIAGSAAAVAMTVTGVTYASADSPQQSAREGVRPASAPLGGDSDYEYKDHHGHKKDNGEIQINERIYAENPGACVAVVRPVNDGTLPLRTFNIFNNTDKIVEFFGAENCSGGEATRVLPGESRLGIFAVPTSSFRVVDFRS